MSKIIKNKDLGQFIKFLVGPSVSALLAFIIVPATTWMVLPIEFGRVSMFSLVISLLGRVAYLGLDRSFVRDFFVSQNKNKLFHQCIGAPFGFSIIFCLVFLFKYSFFSKLLWGEPNFLASVLLCLSVFLSVLERFGNLIVRMEEKALLYSFLLIFRHFSNLILTLFLLYIMPRNYITIIIASTISHFLTVLVNFIYTKQYWCSSWVKTFYVPDLIYLLRFGLPLVPASIMMWFLGGMDKIALRQWSTLQDIGIYSAGFKIVGIMTIIDTAFSTFWAPTSYRWFESGVSSGKFDKVTNILCIGLSVIALLMTASKDLIVLIIGPEYRLASKLVPFLLFVPTMNMLSQVTGSGIGFVRRSEFHLFASGTAALLNFIGNWILVPKYGAIGAAIATALSYTIYMIFKSIIANWLWRKSIGTKSPYVCAIFMLVLSFLTLYFK